MLTVKLAAKKSRLVLERVICSFNFDIASSRCTMLLVASIMHHDYGSDFQARGCCKKNLCLSSSQKLVLSPMKTRKRYMLITLCLEKKVLIFVFEISQSCRNAAKTHYYVLISKAFP